MKKNMLDNQKIYKQVGRVAGKKVFLVIIKIDLLSMLMNPHNDLRLTSEEQAREFIVIKLDCSALGVLFKLGNRVVPQFLSIPVWLKLLYFMARMNTMMDV